MKAIQQLAFINKFNITRVMKKVLLVILNKAMTP